MAAASGLRERRLACGMTQAELAARAGVSRQLVAAVEAARNAPAVDAALGLARALGTTVEQLFTPTTAAVSAIGGTLDEGARLRLGKVGNDLVATELPDHGITGSIWAKPDAVVEGGEVRLIPGSTPAGFVIAGCDPALGVAEAMLAGMGPLSLLAIIAPSGHALQAMAEGTIHAAAVHGRADHLPVPPVKVTRWHLASWQVGLAVTPGLGGGSLEAVLRSDRPIVQQDSGAACQMALERAARAVGIDPLCSGPRASGHLDAARQAQSSGGAGVTMEAAALAFDLDFIPLELHVEELWVDDRWLGHPGLVALAEILTAPAFTARVALFGGYDLAHCGERIAAA